jgi:D-lactate dehydrogenase (cytochrome)
MFNEGLVNRALAMGGMCTGEHEVGQSKIASFKKEHNAATLDRMALLKHALDPQNIFNPGKMVRFDRR